MKVKPEIKRRCRGCGHPILWWAEDRRNDFYFCMSLIFDVPEKTPSCESYRVEQPEHDTRRRRHCSNCKTCLVWWSDSHDGDIYICLSILTHADGWHRCHVVNVPKEDDHAF